MATFEASSVYRVIPDQRAVGLRAKPEISPVCKNFLTSPYTSPFWASGIERHDFAISGSILDDQGVVAADYFVTRSSQNQGLLVPSSTFRNNLPEYFTPEIAKKFATLSFEEIALFGISTCITSYLKERYPDARGFAR